MRHFGVLAQTSEGGALCFRAFCQEGFATLGEHEHPDVTMDCIALARSMPALAAGDHDAVRLTLAVSVDRLRRAGADFFGCPSNTAHVALERPGPELALPGLHIAEEVAATAAKDGRTCVGLLGTAYTMASPVYPDRFAAYGIATQVPDEGDRRTVDRVIFDELVNGVTTDRSRAECLDVVERLASRGCDAVALACTELPLLIGDDDAAVPALDSTRVLARAAFDVAVGRRELPTWRGGPPGSRVS